MQLIPSNRSVERTSSARAAGGGETMGKGFELVVVLVVFCGLGWLLDRALGTSPWCVVAFAVFGMVGQFVRMWYAYDAEMRRHEETHVQRREGRAG